MLYEALEILPWYLFLRAAIDNQRSVGKRQGIITSVTRPDRLGTLKLHKCTSGFSTYILQKRIKVSLYENIDFLKLLFSVTLNVCHKHT